MRYLKNHIQFGKVATMSLSQIELFREIKPDDTIPEFFSGKSVFITGASGFMGKALLEKLLRSCPDIGRIYIMIRLKRGNTMNARLKKITDNVLFDTLRECNPDALNKIIPIEGDIGEINLGILEQDRAEIIENVSIVYHVAATVRFNETMTESVLMNTRGTREVCNLVLALKKVDAFLHVSTAYSQLSSVVEEELYPPPANWREIIKIAEDTDQYTMKIISPKLRTGYPNNYTYAKALAEGVVKDLCESKVPTIIIRPTIVTCAYKDPMPGWVDNMNGPLGISFAVGKGILRSTYLNYDSNLDFIPVDCAIVAFIKATWLQQYLNPNKIAVYNCSGHGILRLKLISFIQSGWIVFQKIPPHCLFYPSLYTTDNKFIHTINIYLFQFLPAVLIDLILKLLNRPPRLLKLQRRIYVALESLEYFLVNNWVFRNSKFHNLDNFVHRNDVSNFVSDTENLDDFEYLMKACEVVAKLLLPKEDSDFESNKIRMQRMKYIHYFVKYSMYFLLFLGFYYYFLIPYIDTFTSIY